MPNRWLGFNLGLLALAGSVAGAQTPAAPSRPLPYPMTPPPEFQKAVSAGTRTTTGRPGPKYWQQYARYTLTGKLDVERKGIDGTGRLTYYNRSPDTLSSLVLNLYQNLHAPGAMRNEEQPLTGGFELRRLAIGTQQIARDTRIGPGYRIEGTILTVRLPRAVPPGDSIELAAEWAFVIPQNGSGRMGWSAGNLFFLAYWYPQFAVYDDISGWNRDRYLGTAEFYMGYADYDVSIEVPRGWLVMATGELQNADSVLADPILERLRRVETTDEVVPIVTSEEIRNNRVTKSRGSRLTWRFTATNQRDFSFSATRESKWDAVRAAVGDRNGDGRADYTRVDAIYRALASRWTESAAYGKHAIEFLSRSSGTPYPWSHMSIIEGDDIVGGGMEYPMLTLISPFSDEDGETLYLVTAHEIFHMWIPMLVGVNEKRYGWIDEGTTDYYETQARKDRYPQSDPETAERQPYLRIAGTSQEDAMMRWTDFQLPGAYVVSSYQKPATVLYALRELIGREAFQRGIQGFIKDWTGKHPTPWDFFYAFNAAAGKDLGWFWRSWYYETWTLDQAVARVEPGAGGTQIVIEDKGLVPMPARVTITLAAGDTLQREVPVETWLGGARTATISVPAPAAVTRVEIDAAKAFPDVSRDNNVWQRQ